MEFTKLNDTTMQVVQQVTQHITLDQLNDQKKQLNEQFVNAQMQKDNIEKAIAEVDQAIAEAQKLDIKTSIEVAELEKAEIVSEVKADVVEDVATEVVAETPIKK